MKKKSPQQIYLNRSPLLRNEDVKNIGYFIGKMVVRYLEGEPADGTTHVKIKIDLTGKRNASIKFRQSRQKKQAD